MAQLSSHNLKTIQEIFYDAGQTDDLLKLREQVVRQVHHAFESTSTIFWMIDDNRLVDPVMHDIQDQYLLPYKDHFFLQNPFDPSSLSGLQQPSVLMEQLISLNQFYQTEYYNDFLRPQKIHRQMAVYIHQGNHLCAVIGMHRSRKKSFGKNYLLMGDLLSHFLSGAFKKIELLEALKKTNNFFRLVSENTDSGILIIDKDNHCVFSNDLAAKMCRSLARGYPVSKDAQAGEDSIPVILLDGCRRQGLVHSREQILCVNQVEQYRVKWQFVDSNTSGEPMGLYLISMALHQAVSFSTQSFFSKRFGLTPREIEVSQLITKGLKNSEIAAVLYISEGTVKNHLKHIFSKTGSSNRTQLAHLTVFRDQDISSNMG